MLMVIQCRATKANAIQTSSSDSQGIIWAQIQLTVLPVGVGKFAACCLDVDSSVLGTGIQS